MTKTIFVLLAMLGAAGNAAADVIYTYVGETYTDIIDLPRPDGTFDTSMRVTGTFVLENALAANTPLTDFGADVKSFSFSNGRFTLTNLDPAMQFGAFLLSTNAAGAIDSWAISVQQVDVFGPLERDVIVQTLNAPDIGFPVEDLGQLDVCSEFDPPGICHTLADVATVEGAAGSWSRSEPPPPVPEPATLGLTALGLLAVARRRRRT
jgi:hypothetical protein